MNISALGASGFTHTNNELHAFAGKVVALAREKFHGQPIQCNLWGYRHDSNESLSCDLISGDNTISLPITIICTGSSFLEFPYLDGIEVVDMVEALHLSSLIIQGVDATVVTGRHESEINESLLARPLEKYETNGQIDLWQNNATEIQTNPKRKPTAMTINNLLPKARIVIDGLLMLLVTYGSFFALFTSFFFINAWYSIEQAGLEQVASMSSAEMYDAAMLIWQSSYDSALYTVFFTFSLYVAGRIIKKKSSLLDLPINRPMEEVAMPSKSSHNH